MKIWQQTFNPQQLLSSLVIYYDDPAWMTILTKLSSNLFSGFKNKAILGSEVTADWFFEENQNLSLFSEKTHWNIVNAEKIPTTVFNKLCKESERIKHNQDTLMWFWFPINSKKKIEIPSFVIDKLPFWEVGSCVKWLMKVWNQNVEQLDKFWPWDQELTLSQHVQLLEMFSNKILEISELKEYFLKIYFEQDKFDLINFLDQKNWKKFWPELKLQLERFENTEKLRLIQLLRSHVFKMAKFKDNPQTIVKSNNDKKIYATSQKWQNREVLRLLKLFSDWEILAKSGDNFQYLIAQEISQ